MFLRWEGDKSTAFLLFNLSFNKKYSEKKFGGVILNWEGGDTLSQNNLKPSLYLKKSLIAKENQTDVIF